MNRHLPVLAAAAAVLLAAGCSGAEHAPRKGAGDPAPSRAAGLELPAHAAVLVPETSGSGDFELARFFTPREGVYTVYARCTGKGRVTVVDAGRPDADPSRIACDQVATVGRVYSEAEAEALSMRVQGGKATWTVAVVAGAHEA
ncbi:hypothetical protein [Streptomyces sp. SID9727]|uniref:hypothetical protein n=1 Tax=Streptomyces sp. SID9727 TaxID=2706114 RepID=UPI0013C908F7|nr:hypothetical protein [Streptomyces sp. SID9727]NEC69701.1 hypothetical protein [Streptomyces sp. SID9727]